MTPSRAMDNPELEKLVAQALCKSRSCEGIACCQWPANRGRTKAQCPVENHGYDDAAKAAIEAIAPALADKLKAQRDEVLEEAAQNCEARANIYTAAGNTVMASEARTCAGSIRLLKSQPDLSGAKQVVVEAAIRATSVEPETVAFDDAMRNLCEKVQAFQSVRAKEGA